MRLPRPARPAVVLLCCALAAACSSSPKKSTPDARPYVPPAADTSIAEPDTAPLDASSEASGETGPASQLVVSPPTLDLGRIPPGVTSPPQTVTVVATRDVSDLTVGLTGQELTLDPASTCGKTLATGESCIVVVTFRSATIGEKSNSVTLAAGGHTTIVPVTAYVLADTALLIIPMTPQSFNAAIGQSSWPVTFSIPNLGTTAFGPVTHELTGANREDFSATATGCELIAPGASCTITVVFTPKLVTGQSATASLVVTGPGPDALTSQIPLVGTVVPFDPVWLSSPTSSLGAVAVGTTGAPVVFTVRNSGDAAVGPLVISLSSPEFVVTEETCSKGAIPADATCTISVALRPRSAGEKSSILTVGIPSGSPIVRALTGTGVASDASPPDTAGIDASDEVLDGAAGS